MALFLLHLSILQYFKENFEFVEPQEYILDSNKIGASKMCLFFRLYRKYESIHDGKYFKQNYFHAGEEVRISLILYVDDFKVCNPLGTSKKKQKITSVYFVLANVPSELRSALTSKYLAVLCKADDVKIFGYKAVLEPLLKDLSILEQEGIFVCSIGKNIKDYIVLQEIIWVHIQLFGLVESFLGPYVCWFCLGHHSDFQQKEVQSGAFPPPTKEDHALHVKTAKENPILKHCYSVKKACSVQAAQLPWYDAVTAAEVCTWRCVVVLQEENTLRFKILFARLTGQHSTEAKMLSVLRGTLCVLNGSHLSYVAEEAEPRSENV
ncbi:hypothetical protein N1851_004491 [Merluccius polli]|uniref:Uncharacterized protein n=1 Tax=Merluccius polli TaxID=89951 RepID=A0AA47N8E4_MERPO|nr:hypothetical protein N1851_004491 [Merluccius polli]